MITTLKPNKGRAPFVITLNLADVRDLFMPTKVDPFHPNYHHLSGMEQIRLALKTEPRRKPPVQTVLILPTPAAGRESLQTETAAAIARYCDVRMSAIHDELLSRRRATYQNLRIGIVILGLSLGLAAAISNADFLSSWLRTLLSNSISILGTVALWSPADAVLFGLRPLYGDMKLYKTIKHMSISLHFAES